jgi:hypothetical protein
MPSERDKTSVFKTILVAIVGIAIVIWAAVNTVNRPAVIQVKQAGAQSDVRNQLIEELAAP